MRHRLNKKSFNRDTKSRRALLMGVTVAVLEHGEIITTKPKGKEASKIIDSVISKAKKGDLASRRQLHRIFGRRDVVNNLCDRVAPVFVNRQSGFTRLVPYGRRRGDNVALYRLSLVEVLPPAKKSAPSDKNAATSKKAVTKDTAAKQSHLHDTQAQEAVKADQNKAKKVTSKIGNLVRRQTANRSTASGGGRGK
ncbi:50S ribosomal protein L17 [bacterium]|nr:50S ribosomal protein L17 [bacterium]